MEVLDFADFDRRFELKINEASEDLIAKKEQGKCSCAVLTRNCERLKLLGLVVKRHIGILKIFQFVEFSYCSSS